MIETVSKDAEYKRVKSKLLTLLNSEKLVHFEYKIDHIEQDLSSTVCLSLLHFLVIMKWRYS